MIEHLSPEEISQWMVGDRTPQLARHVTECPECRCELERMETALSQFRGAMRDPANLMPSPAWREPASRGHRISWAGLAVAAVLLMICVAIPSYRHAEERESAQAAAAAALADSQLLERVDSAISQAVPEPMEPLVPLVKWNGSAEQNSSGDRQ